MEVITYDMIVFIFTKNISCFNDVFEKIEITFIMYVIKCGVIAIKFNV